MPVEVISGVVGFFLLYLIVTTVGTIVLTVQDMDLVSAFTATLTCISNVGPGLGAWAGGQLQPCPDAVQMGSDIVHVAGPFGDLRHPRAVHPEFWRD